MLVVKMYILYSIYHLVLVILESISDINPTRPPAQMSGLVKPEFASPTGLTPEAVGSNIASANVIDNLITRYNSI